MKELKVEVRAFFNGKEHKIGFNASDLLEESQGIDAKRLANFFNQSIQYIIRGLKVDGLKFKGV